jgi:hypothetical protein
MQAFSGWPFLQMVLVLLHSVVAELPPLLPVPPPPPVMVAAQAGSQLCVTHSAEDPTHELQALLRSPWQLWTQVASPSGHAQ